MDFCEDTICRESISRQSIHDRAYLVTFTHVIIIFRTDMSSKMTLKSKYKGVTLDREGEFLCKCQQKMIRLQVTDTENNMFGKYCVLQFFHQQAHDTNLRSLEVPEIHSSGNTSLPTYRFRRRSIASEAKSPSAWSTRVPSNGKYTQISSRDTVNEPERARHYRRS